PLEEYRDAAGREGRRHHNPLRTDASAIQGATQQTDPRLVLAWDGSAARAQERGEAWRRLDGPSSRVPQLTGHDEAVARLRLEQALRMRGERERVGVPDDAVDARELGRPCDETDQEDAARGDARHIDRTGEAHREARVEIEAVQLGEESHFVAQ